MTTPEIQTCPECGHDAYECLLCIDEGCGNCDCGCECDYVPQGPAIDYQGE